MKYLILPIVSFSLLFMVLLALLMKDPSREHWEKIGPKWHCAFNPDTSEFCVEKNVGSNNN